MKLLNKLKSDRKELINNLNENIVSLEEIAYKQQLEIEQWKEEANKYQNLWCEAVKDAESIKTEAIKEFAERLKEKVAHILSEIFELDYEKVLKKVNKKILKST